MEEIRKIVKADLVQDGVNTCFEDGDCCDFKVKAGTETLDYWPPVFEQGKGYK